MFWASADVRFVPNRTASLPTVTTRFVLAEDSYLMREGLRSMLDLAADIELLATCEDYDELMEAVEAHEPAVVLTGAGRSRLDPW